MGDLRVIVTGAGAPGIKGTIYSLKNNTDSRNIYIVGTDVNENVVGKYLCDDFKVIPPAKNVEEYLSVMLRLCEVLEIDVLIPQNTVELQFLSDKKSLFEVIGTKVLVSNRRSIETANSKFEILKICKNHSLPVPEFYLVNTTTELKKIAKKLGWPQKKVVVKPPVSNGQRGVRVIDENINLRDAFYNEKPSSLVTQMPTLLNILGEEFPELIVTEYLSGPEYTVDVMRTDDRTIAIPRKRDLIRSGITFNGSLIKHYEIISHSEKIAEAANLEYCFGFQFKENDNGEPAILECNPRIQGSMVLSTIAGANIIYGSLKYLLKEDLPEFQIDWNTKLLRYWGGICIKNKNIISL